MARDHNRSRLLRQLAEHLMAQVPEALVTSTRADLSTSLVRQWLTYDNHATLIFGAEQHYFRPGAATGTVLPFDLERVAVDTWFRQCMEDWDFGEEELSRAIRHLNLGQCAQLENQRGQFLRLWVNPQTRSKGVEVLGPHVTDRIPRQQLLQKIALREIESLFGARASAAAKEDLIAAVVRQWTLHDDHALILTHDAKYHLVLTPQPDGMTQATRKPLATSLPRKLLDCGLTPEEVAQFLHVLNLGLAPEITDEQGRRCRVVIDPRTAAVGMELVYPPPG